MSAKQGNLTRGRSDEAFRRAEALMPGGVSSPVRAFGAVGGKPLFIARGAGARIWDLDGNEFLDYVLSWGPLILGHAHPKVVEAVRQALESGSSFGAPTVREIELAERIREAMPAVEQVRFVNSGTEATMSAVRLARAATGRPAILKFEGCYHGHVDALLVQAGSGAMTFGVPSSPGVPPEVTQHTLLAPYNDLEAVERVGRENRGRLAAILVEPVAGNMGVVPPADGFLEGLRGVADRTGALLIYDEVMTGFRVARSGAAQRYGVRPDLVTLGKVIGGGLPVGAYGGRRDLMQQVSPVGPVYQAGTLSGNPLAMAAGIATLDLLAEPNAYETLEARSARLEKGLAEAVREAKISARVQRVGSMLTLFFTAGAVADYAGARACDTEAFGRFFQGMLGRGVYLPPSQFEAWFVSLAHTDEDIRRTVEAARGAFSAPG
ncbi:MAG: glutamate-1-semialdehyde 2,1-aminomutase [Planctomycetota bacterium]|nr:glutamate-1-semialdehyde 2,1-aminomutase [Planctomycetota bacterium]